MPRAKESDFLDHDFYRLTVEKCWRDSKGNLMCDCHCSCGGTKTTSAGNLKCGNTQSCGCKQAENVARANHDRTCPRSGPDGTCGCEFGADGRKPAPKIHVTRARRRAQGLCGCGEATVAGKKSCQLCLDKNLKKVQHHAAKRKIEGRCSCGQKLLGTYKRCNACRARKKDRVVSLIAAGMCIMCGQNEAMSGRRHCDECSAKVLRKNRSDYRRVKRQVLEHYGAYCACCGLTEYEFLTIDHIHGGGGKHRKEVNGGRPVYFWIRKNGYPEGFQVLCYNCNCAKGFFGECPHKRKPHLWQDGVTMGLAMG